MRKQNGTIVRIRDRWYVRYWERRNIAGTSPGRSSPTASESHST